MPSFSIDKEFDLNMGVERLLFEKACFNATDLKAENLKFILGGESIVNKDDNEIICPVEKSIAELAINPVV